MRKLLIIACVVPLLFLDMGATSIGTGIFPNTTVLVGMKLYTVGSLTRVSNASCGGNIGVTACHRSAPFITKVDVTVADLVLAKSASTTITVKGSNPGVPGIRGGFCADVTNGSLVAGTNTKINAAGNEITHTSFIARNWSFGYKAGTTTGLAEFYTVVNCVNGNGLADGADEWAFNSSKILASQATPVRLYINADGIRSTGRGCEDGYGNQAVIGAPNPPTVGNSNFKIEAFGLPPSSQFMFMMNLGGNVPGYDMAPMGAMGCVLRTTLQIQLIGPTSGGDAVRGEGKVILPAPIPNDNALKGLILSMQIGAIDKNPKRPCPMVVTNGIEVKIL